LCQVNLTRSLVRRAHVTSRIGGVFRLLVRQLAVIRPR
jgi:uncharacterized protein YjhX (UPF0386 family)